MFIFASHAALEARRPVLIKVCTRLEARQVTVPLHVKSMQTKNGKRVLTVFFLKVRRAGGRLCTSENPKTSLLLHIKFAKKILATGNWFKIDFNLCADCLALLGAEPCTYCKKSTSIVANFKGVERINKQCLEITIDHKHKHAWGSQRVNDVSISLASKVWSMQKISAKRLPR